MQDAGLDTVPLEDTMVAVYVDADACPVKDEALRVAIRHGLNIYYVSNSWMRLPDDPSVHRVVVDAGPDAADDWIVTQVVANDVVVTADIPLASRCLKSGAQAIGPTGKPFTEAGIGMALAMRDLSAHLREIGESKGYNAAFTRQDRSKFLQAMEMAVQKALRSA